MSVLVVMPAYNVGRTVAEIVERVCATNLADEIAIVNDGSNDNTSEVLKSLEVTALEHKQNSGYGAAQKTLYRYALSRDHEHIVILHSDGGHNPEELPEMLEPLKSGRADVVMGSRMRGMLASAPRLLGSHWLGACLRGPMPLHRFLGNVVLTALQNFCFGTRLRCFHDGYRAMTRQAVSQLPFESLADGYHYDNEILLAAHRMKLRIAEVPVSTNYRDDVGSKAPAIRYGFKTLSFALGYRFGLGRAGRSFRKLLAEHISKA